MKPLIHLLLSLSTSVPAFAGYYEENNSQVISERLSSLRYFPSVSNEELQEMSKAFEKGYGDPSTRIILAEQIYDKSKIKNDKHLQFIYTHLNSRDSLEVASAANSLGYLRINTFIPTATEMVTSGDEALAKSAAYGLLWFERPDVLTRLCNALTEREKLGLSGSMEIRSYINTVTGQHCPSPHK